MTTTAVRPATARPSTARKLLACGIAAGPVFVVAGLGHAVLRPGFDLSVHAMSMLALGDTGWIQTANFLLSGALVLLWAAGTRRAQPSRWLPRLLTVLGIGLIAAGVFPADPAYGFPEGAPAGMPETMSTAGALHGVAFGIAMVGWIGATVALTRHFAKTGSRGWALSGVAAVLVLLAPLPLMASPGGSTALYVSSFLSWTWFTAVAIRFTRAQAR